MKDALDFVIRESLIDFLDYIRSNPWWGREREAISLYVTGYLIRRCARGSPLHDLRQIAIEGAVAQIGGKGKKHVCKDLVIWPEPAMTCWDKDQKPTNIPLAIVEWKVDQRESSSRDIAWLQEFSKNKMGFVGFAVNLVLRSSNRCLTCSRIVGGDVDTEWLVIPPDVRIDALPTRR